MALNSVGGLNCISVSRRSALPQKVKYHLFHRKEDALASSSESICLIGRQHPHLHGTLDDSHVLLH